MLVSCSAVRYMLELFGGPVPHCHSHILVAGRELCVDREESELSSSYCGHEGRSFSR